MNVEKIPASAVCGDAFVLIGLIIDKNLLIRRNKR